MWVQRAHEAANDRLRALPGRGPGTLTQNKKHIMIKKMKINLFIIIIFAIGITKIPCEEQTGGGGEKIWDFGVFINGTGELELFRNFSF